MITRKRLYLFILTLLTTYTTHPGAQRDSQQEKPYLWVYWENINRTSMPAHIALCRKTLLKHCKDSFNIVELDDKNIYNYLPDLKKLEKELGLDRLKIAQKVDFYRIYLLQQHGGLYIDSDMVVMRDMREVTDKLVDHDYVGFGEFYIDQGPYNSYGAPQNWAMASRKHGILVTRMLNRCIKILSKTKSFNDQQFEAYFQTKTIELKAANENEIEWHTLGKNLIRDTLASLLKEGYKYYHYSNEVDGTRDAHGHIIKTAQKFTNQPIVYKDIKKLLFIFISNAHICAKMKYRLTMTEEEFLKEDTNFAKYVKISLGLA